MYIVENETIKPLTIESKLFLDFCSITVFNWLVLGILSKSALCVAAV
jgi:hypothetical protein